MAVKLRVDFWDDNRRVLDAEVVDVSYDASGEATFVASLPNGGTREVLARSTTVKREEV